jgi:hypothetical protein
VRFLADMCMDVRLASWLNSQGHEAIHLRDEGLQRLPNGGIFEKAITESRVVVTFDLDFGEIVALAQRAKDRCYLIPLAKYSGILCDSAPRRRDLRMRGCFDERGHCNCRGGPSSN